MVLNMNTEKNTQVTFTPPTQKAVNAFKGTLSDMLNVSLVDNITAANMAFKTADYIADSTKLPLARLYYVVKSQELYRQANFKTYEKWAEKTRNVSRATLFQYAQIGKYVTPDGQATIFKRPDGKDFDFTALKLIVTGLSVKLNGKLDEQATIERINDVLEKELITPDFTANMITKKIKELKDLESGKNLESLNGTINTTDSADNADKADSADTVDKADSADTADNADTVIIKSALYSKYLPKFIELVRLALNTNNESLLSLKFDD